MARICPACGANVAQTAKFCTECGADLQSEHFAQPSHDAAGVECSPRRAPSVSPMRTDTPPTAEPMPSASDALLPELTELLSNVMPAESALGSEIVVEVETNRPCLLNHAGLLRFRVTNNLHGPCSVAIGMRLHGQGSYVNQDLAEAEQCCEFQSRGDQRMFSFPFLATCAGDISVQQLRLALCRREKADETVLYELPDRSLFIHVSDPAVGAGAPGIVISGGIHIDLSQLKEMYGSDIKDILNLHTGRGNDPAHAAIAWAPILLRFSRVESVESLPADIRLALPGGVSCDLLRIRAGQFTMGSPDEQGKEDERPRHPVRMTRDFYLSKHLITQEQYQAVMGQNPARFALSPQHPVDNVSWDDAQQFCLKLRQHLMQNSETLAEHGLKLDGVRLPTEAQWEYACRAGTDTAWSFGDDRQVMPEYGWHEKNSAHTIPGSRKQERTTHPVGLLKPNAWGLYDVHGNLWEWCEDFYAPDYGQAREVDPTGPATGDRRVLRGGSWSVFARDCRSAQRHAAPPGARTHNYGFRIVLLVAEVADRRNVLQRLLRQLSR